MDDVLTPQDRFRVFQLIVAADPKLADRVSALLDDRDDPVVRLLTTQAAQQLQAQNAAAAGVAAALHEVKDQMRQLMLVMTFVSIVAMCLNAALVGVSVKMSGRWGSFSTTGADAPASPAPDQISPHPEP